MSKIHALAPAYRKLLSKNAPSAIVHLGVGNFFRSHLNYITHQALENEHSTTTTTNNNDNNEINNWTIHGLGLTTDPNELKLHQALQDQSHLYSVLSLPSGQLDVVGALTGLTHVRHSIQGLEKGLRQLSAPETKIISMTVTEKGYHQNTAGTINFESEDIQSDIQRLSSNAIRDIQDVYPLKTTLGLILSGLSLRKHIDIGGGAPVTLLCCDNLPHNGNVLKSLVHEMANELDSTKEFSNWITNKVSFPNSMVDRITPAATDLTKQRIKNELGIDCQAPIQAEDFLQWVVEDDFVGGRPQWEFVKGVTFCDDLSKVKKYEDMKLRLLNGSHTALSYISSLLFLQSGGSEEGAQSTQSVTVDRAMSDPLISSFVRQYMNEVAPTLKGGPEGEEMLLQYQQDLMHRFSNAEISDLCSRLCQDGSKKCLGFLVPGLTILLKENQDFTMCAKVLASWYVYLQQWNVSDIDDPGGKKLLNIAREDDLTSFLCLSCGNGIGSDERVVRSVKKEVELLKKKGARMFLKE